MRVYERIQINKLKQALECSPPGKEIETLRNFLQSDSMDLLSENIKKQLKEVFLHDYPSVVVEEYGSVILNAVSIGTVFDFYVTLSSEHLNPTERTCRNVKRLLENSKYFMYCKIVNNEHGSVLRCRHKDSKVDCIINISCVYGVLNSWILAHLLNFDSRIRDLLITLKCWAKLRKLGESQGISNYALFWLIVFYLQSIEEPIIPPMKELQLNESPYLVNGYNFGFKHVLTNNTTNRQSLYTLLKGFFEFYNDFDFSKRISPLLGKAVRIDENKAGVKRNTVTSEKYLHIQDPFETDRILCYNNEMFNKLLRNISEAKEVLQPTHNNPEGSKQSDSWFLNLLWVGNGLGNIRNGKLNQKKSPERESVCKNDKSRKPENMKLRELRQKITKTLEDAVPGKEVDALHHTLLADLYHMKVRCQKIKKDLKMALLEAYSTVDVVVYGSTVMKMAFKDYDFDFYVKVPPSTLDSKDQLREARRLLKKSTKFDRCSAILGAKVPVLKCYHKETGINCDINFSCSYGSLNSPIMAHLLTLDHRIYELAIIIKCWMKIHGLYGPHKISNYRMLLLIMFYLQRISHPIMPPIEDFQRNVQPFLVNGNNFAFNYSFRHVTTNRENVVDLLKGFFEFYSNFDFKKVISPLHGTIEDSKPSKLGSSRSYIQDPFVTDCLVSFPKAQLIRKISEAKAVFETSYKSSKEAKQLLIHLFSNDSKQLTQKLVIKEKVEDSLANNFSSEIESENQLNTAIFSTNKTQFRPYVSSLLTVCCEYLLELLNLRVRLYDQ